MHADPEQTVAEGCQMSDHLATTERQTENVVRIAFTVQMQLIAFLY